MKLTKSQLKQIIKEELEEVVGSDYPTNDIGARRNIILDLKPVIERLKQIRDDDAKEDNPEVFKAIDTAYTILDDLSADLKRDYPARAAAEGIDDQGIGADIHPDVALLSRLPIEYQEYLARSPERRAEVLKRLRALDARKNKR